VNAGYSSSNLNT